MAGLPGCVASPSLGQEHPRIRAVGRGTPGLRIRARGTGVIGIHRVQHVCIGSLSAERSAGSAGGPASSAKKNKDAGGRTDPAGIRAPDDADLDPGRVCRRLVPVDRLCRRIGALYGAHDRIFDETQGYRLGGCTGTGLSLIHI